MLEADHERALILRTPSGIFKDDEIEVQLQTPAIIVDICNTTANAQAGAEPRPIEVKTLLQRLLEAVRTWENVTTFAYTDTTRAATDSCNKRPCVGANLANQNSVMTQRR